MDRRSGTFASRAPTQSARRARGAVVAVFFANGALFANLVPRYPEIKSTLTLSNTAFGSAIAAYGVGALGVGLLAGVLVSRLGSVRVAPVSTALIAGNLVLIGAAPSWFALAAALFVAGALDAIADVAVNVHGLRVERLYHRSILNSLHGVWSIGAVVGGAMGATAAGLRLPLLWHLSGAAALFVALAAGVSRSLLPGRDDRERETNADNRVRRAPALRRVHIVRSVLALGGIAAAAQVIEDTGATWGAVYLREDLGAAPAFAGLGFIALQALQTVGRLLGDRVVTRYGDRSAARAGAALAGVAMTAALVAPAPGVTVVAFGVAGLGIGTLIPASLRAADDLPGLPRGIGITVVGSVDRIAMLVAPPVIGLVADTRGLRAGLLVIPLAAVVVLLVARVLPAVPQRSS